MSEVDLRLAEAAEDAHARALDRAEDAIRLYEADPYWWPTDATPRELASFASRVLRVLKSGGSEIDRLRKLYDIRRSLFTETAMRRAGVED